MSSYMRSSPKKNKLIHVDFTLSSHFLIGRPLLILPSNFIKLIVAVVAARSITLGSREMSVNLKKNTLILRLHLDRGIPYNLKGLSEIILHLLFG